MKLQIGKAYKLKSGLLVRLQGLSRSITRGTLDGSIRHFVELSFQDLSDKSCYVVRVPFDERLKPEAEIATKIVEAIVNGSPIPVSEPRDRLESSESP